MEPIQSLPESSEPSKSSPEIYDRLYRAIPGVMERYGIPKKFINADWLRPTSLAMDLIHSTGVCLTGKAGVGKTAALCLLVRDWLIESAKKSNSPVWGNHYSWRFISFPEFIMEVQDSFRRRDGEQSAFDMLKSIAETKHLIIDDLGAEKPTEYVRQATYYIINHREMHMLPTFITTNFSMDHLDQNLDSRISSRIAGMCEIIRFEGKDRRLEK